MRRNEHYESEIIDGQTKYRCPFCGEYYIRVDTHLRKSKCIERNQEIPVDDEDIDSIEVEPDFNRSYAYGYGEMLAQGFAAINEDGNL